jgi:hypothetical protein
MRMYSRIPLRASWKLSALTPTLLPRLHDEYEKCIIRTEYEYRGIPQFDHSGSVLMAGRPRKQQSAKPATSLEQRLWDAADALRGNQEPSEYKHVVLGLVFLKYISDRFGERRRALEVSLGDPNSDDYIPHPAAVLSSLRIATNTPAKMSSGCRLTRAGRRSRTAPSCRPSARTSIMQWT